MLSGLWVLASCLLAGSRSSQTLPKCPTTIRRATPPFRLRGAVRVRVRCSAPQPRTSGTCQTVTLVVAVRGFVRNVVGGGDLASHVAQRIADFLSSFHGVSVFRFPFMVWALKNKDALGRERRMWSFCRLVDKPFDIFVRDIFDFVLVVDGE